MKQPFIVQINRDLLDNLGINLNAVGVDHRGNPGGIFLRCEYYPEHISALVPLDQFDQLCFIYPGFFGQPTVLTNKDEELLVDIDRLQRVNSSLKAQVLTLTEQLNNAMVQQAQQFKLCRELMDALKYGQEVESEDQQQDSLLQQKGVPLG